MAGPIFPDVPAALGVPRLNRNETNLGSDTVDPLAKDGITVQGNTGNRWGIFNGDGKSVLDADAVMSVGYSAEHRLADFPIEDGGFETYDKVQMPFEARVVLSKGGKFADRREFIATLETLRDDRELYSVVTPERTYLDANIYRVVIDRSRENGAGIITAEIMLREIRQNVTTEFSSTKDAASADTKSDGAVQAKPATADTSSLPERPAIAQASDVEVAAKANLAPTGPLQIPTLSLPAQSLTVQLGQQLTKITALQKRTGLFLDLAVNGVPIAQGLKCLDRTWILGNSYSGFLGDLAFIDMQGKADPSFSSLASRFQLVWSGI